MYVMMLCGCQEAHVDRGDTQRAIVVYRDIAVRHTTSYHAVCLLHDLVLDVCLSVCYMT